MNESKPTCGWNESKPYMTLTREEADAITAEKDRLRASLAAAEAKPAAYESQARAQGDTILDLNAKLADAEKHADAQHVHADMALWHLNDRRYQEAKKELEAEGNAHGARRAARDGQEETR